MNDEISGKLVQSHRMSSSISGAALEDYRDSRMHKPACY